MHDNIKEFVNIIKTRGFIHQTTDLEELQSSFNKIIGYTGFDCTSNTLHVGSLLQLMLLKWLQKTSFLRPLSIQNTMKIDDFFTILIIFLKTLSSL